MHEKAARIILAVFSEARSLTPDPFLLLFVPFLIELDLFF